MVVCDKDKESRRLGLTERDELKFSSLVTSGALRRRGNAKIQLLHRLRPRFVRLVPHKPRNIVSRVS